MHVVSFCGDVHRHSLYRRNVVVERTLRHIRSQRCFVPVPSSGFCARKHLCHIKSVIPGLYVSRDIVSYTIPKLSAHDVLSGYDNLVIARPSFMLNIISVYTPSPAFGFLLET